MSLLAQGLEGLRRALSSRTTSFETEHWSPVPAPEFDPAWAARHAPDPDDDFRELDQRLRNRNMGVALPCSRWERGVEHDQHTWDNYGTPAHCQGWRGLP